MNTKTYSVVQDITGKKGNFIKKRESTALRLDLVFVHRVLNLAASNLLVGLLTKMRLPGRRVPRLDA